MFTWVTLLAKIASIADRISAWAKQNSDQNVGRQLQQTDDLKASVKADHDAAKTRDDVAGLSDAQLDSELRGSSQANR